MVYTMGMKHGLTIFRPAIVRDVTRGVDSHKLPSVRPGLHQLAGTAPVIDSRVRTGLQHGGQPARPHRFTTPRPIHPFAHMDDSSVIDFSFTGVIINSAVGIFWLTYQVKTIHYIFILYIAFFKKSNYSGLQVFQCRTNCLLQKGIIISLSYWITRAGLYRGT